jgi:hypothetical protein
MYRNKLSENRRAQNESQQTLNRKIFRRQLLLQNVSLTFKHNDYLYFVGLARSEHMDKFETCIQGLKVVESKKRVLFISISLKCCIVADFANCYIKIVYYCLFDYSLML